MSSAIVLENLQKSYKDVRALDGVSLDIPEGEFFGLLGPNGAGKTTLISCLVGLARPDSGTINIFGNDLKQDQLTPKRMIGYVPQEVNLEYFFPISKALEFQGGYFGLSRKESRARAEELLKRFGIWDKRNVQYFRLSGGMKRRLMIVRALMGHPKLLILDEPTAGVDVEQRHELWSVLREMRSSGVSILLTTHYIDEAEALCQRVGIIHKGKIEELDSPVNLIKKYCSRKVVIELSRPVEKEMFAGLEGMETDVQGCKVVATPNGSLDNRLGPLVEQLTQRIMQQSDCRIVDLQVRGGDLEEVFLKVTGSCINAS